jgi:hypothetical protein
VEVGSSAFTTLAGSCTARASAPGSLVLTLPAFAYAVCSATGK